MNARAATLAEVIELLEELDREQQKTQKKYGGELKWQEVARVGLVRRGIQSSTKAVRKLAQEKITVV